MHEAIREEFLVAEARFKEIPKPDAISVDNAVKTLGLAIECRDALLRIFPEMQEFDECRATTEKYLQELAAVTANAFVLGGSCCHHQCKDC